jgi:hypothetical protein
MATRSTIAIELDDGSVKQVYCHWDGYLAHNGKLLQEFYNDYALAEQLVIKGDISSLGKYITPTTDTHSWINPEEGCTVYYGRDRSEDNVHPRQFTSFQDYVKNARFEEFNYIWRNGEWLVSEDNNCKWRKVSEELTLEHHAA